MNHKVENLKERVFLGAGKAVLRARDAPVEFELCKMPRASVGKARTDSSR